MATVHLVLADDAGAAELGALLKAEGYAGQVASSLAGLRLLCEAARPHIVIAQRYLPDGDALQWAGLMRSSHPSLGVVVLDAQAGDQARIEALESGADHCLRLPAQPRELLAIVKNLQRRQPVVQHWRLMSTRCELRVAGGRLVDLTAQESSFLRALLLSPGRVVNRRRVLESMGKSYMHYDARNLDALLLRLRKKVLTVSSHSLPIKTVHGIGYVAPADFELSDG